MYLLQNQNSTSLRCFEICIMPNIGGDSDDNDMINHLCTTYNKESCQRLSETPILYIKHVSK